MLSPEISYLVYQEQHRTRLQATERRRLLAEIAGPNRAAWHRAACRYAGRLLQNAGSRLVRYSEKAPSRQMATRI